MTGSTPLPLPRPGQSLSSRQARRVALRAQGFGARFRPRGEVRTAHLRAVAREAEPFDVTLEGADTFLPTSPVSYLRVIQGADSLAALEASVRRGPLGFDPLFPYVPHVTLVHEDAPDLLRRSAQECSGFRDGFRATSIGLYQKSPSGDWAHREEIPLGTHHTSEE